jgi:hypothetical protein
MGAHRPLHLRLHKSCRKWPMWNQLLDCLGIFLSCHLLSEPTLMYITRNQGTEWCQLIYEERVSLNDVFLGW